MEPSQMWKLRLKQRRPEAGTVFTFAFEPLRPLDFRAGQWIHLAAAPLPVDRSLVRHMSIASAPADPLVEFTMDLASGSAYKQAMAALTPGDEVAAFKLKGDFVVDPSDPTPVVFLAGGLGITPVRSLLRDLADAGAPAPRWLVHVSRNEHLFAEELGTLPIPQWRVNREGLAAVWPLVLGEAGPRARFYVSGSDRFVAGLTADLAQAGVGPDRIVIENFTKKEGGPR